MTSSAADRIRNEAVLWCTRLKSPELSEEQRQAHRQWMEQDALHRDAFNLVETEYQDLGQLDSWAQTELQQLEAKFAVQTPVDSAPVITTVTQVRKARFSGLLGVGSIVASIFAIVAVAALFFVLNQAESIYYETAKGEQRKIMLVDGSRVHLNSSSSIEVSFSNQRRHILLHKGEGLFDVAHERNRPFVVQVGTNIVVAVGTSFNVYASKQAVDVTVVEGRVAIVPVDNELDTVELTRVASSGKTGLLLEKNHSAHVDESGLIVAVEEVDAERLTAWDRGFIVFDQTPLREVAQELSRYMTGSVTVAEDVPDYPVTGAIKISDRETMLGLLSEVVPVISVRQSATSTMLYPKASTPQN